MDALASPLCGDFLQSVMAAALKVGEQNACMGRIVAAPTAGASGVMPAVLLPLQKREGLSDETMVQCLYTAAGFGQVIATRASISGAEGGCQAEIGAASAMSAAALVHARGGTAGQMADACAMALQNVMGLVCDPVAGLVEEPCVKRNVMGAVNAMACADMAEAAPISAWHPPSAPEMDALVAITWPKPAATYRHWIIVSSESPSRSCRGSSTAGMTPLAPAVGAATINPMVALTSSTAME